MIHSRHLFVSAPWLAVATLVTGAIALYPTHSLQASPTEATPPIAAIKSTPIATKPFPLDAPPPILSPEPSLDISEASTTASDLAPAAEGLPLAADAVSAEPPALAQTPPSPQPDAEPAFGSRGDRRWYAQGGGALTLTDDEINFGMAGAGVSHFFADGHSINLELNTMAFSQPGADALGLNLAALLRWDFIRQDTWSLYIDGGAGILGTTNPMPSRGSSFNFTPQAGGGATIQLEGGNRLMVGVRWHHVSNANLYENNPGLDTILGYVGINFPR